MQYRKFRIENFKGIKSATIDLKTNGSARVFTFVGLNEGGKTTALEAIHSFKPDIDSGTVVGGEQNTYRLLRQAVPRSQISDFNGEISVEAHISLEEGDADELLEALA